MCSFHFYQQKENTWMSSLLCSLYPFIPFFFFCYCEFWVHTNSLQLENQVLLRVCYYFHFSWMFVFEHPLVFIWLLKFFLNFFSPLNIMVNAQGWVSFLNCHFCSLNSLLISVKNKNCFHITRRILKTERYQEWGKWWMKEHLQLKLET